MNKMLGYVEGADLYLIISLFIFIIVFVVAAIQIFTMPKAHIEELENLPLNAENEDRHEN